MKADNQYALTKVIVYSMGCIARTAFYMIAFVPSKALLAHSLIVTCLTLPFLFACFFAAKYTFNRRIKERLLNAKRSCDTPVGPST